MGTADTETGRDIWKHCKEAVFSDVFIWDLNGRGKGKSVQVDPQVKLHCQVTQGCSVKESRGQPKNGALKQAIEK